MQVTHSQGVVWQALFAHCWELGVFLLLIWAPVFDNISVH